MSGEERLGRRRLILTVIVALCAIIGGYGYITTGQTADSGRIYLANAGGGVMFEHRAHSELVENCADCHHDNLTASLANDCADCHDDDLVADDFTHADLSEIHAYECSRCHDVNQASANQPCRECHPAVQEGEPGMTACSECHDDDYSADMIGHDDMITIESHSCNSCHVPRSVSDVYHEQCSRCHELNDRDRFVDSDGSARCNICHLK